MIPKAELVLGPPGTGKTYYLIQQIKEALANGAHPSRVGVISFTRKAIEEMVTRACAEFNLEAKDFPHMRTSHSFGFRGLGLQSQDVMNKEDYDNIGREIGLTFEGKIRTNLEDGMSLPTLGGSGSKYLLLENRARLRMIDLDTEFNQEGDRDLFFPKLEQLSKQLIEYKAATSKYDYVDMIEKYITLGIPPNLDYLFIDEAQDFTPLQWRMAEKIAEKSEKVYIAGDDDQAIHRWTGVDVKEFNKSSNNVKVLAQSYRIPRSVHALAKTIAQRVEDRHVKQFNARDEEGTVEYVYHLEDVPLHEGSWTIMARTNGYVYELAKHVRKAGFKYSIKGRPSIPLELVANLGTWNDLCAGKSVGLQRIKDLYSAVPKQGKNAVVRRGSQQMLDVLAPDAELDIEILQLQYGLLAGPEQSAYEVMRVGRDDQDYIDAMARRGDDLMSEPRIKLSTFHAMKGGEDDNCVVYTMSTAACVNSDHPDDEHRAFYVGVTRARHTLYILQSNYKYRYTI